MDSRQFAILVLAIFIPTLVLATQETNGTAVGPQVVASSSNKNITAETSVPSSLKSDSALVKPADESSTTTIKSVTEGKEFSSTTTIKSAEPTESPTTTSKSAEPIKSSTATTGKVSVAEVDSKATEAPAAGPAAAPTVSNTNSAKPTEVLNDHAIRDVSSEKCSTSYMAENKVNWVPEKAILAVVEGGAVVTVDQLCDHLDRVQRLNAICNNTKVKLDSEDKKVAPIVAGLYSMFSNVCNDKKSFIVPDGNSTPCVELIQSTTKNCSTLAKAIFPTEVLLEEMVEKSCSVVLDTKECIINGLEQSDKCSVSQRRDLKKMINMVTKVLPCSLPISPETSPAPTEAPSTTTPTTTPPATTTPTVITTKSHSYSSANGLQVNFFTVLPVLLVAFKFY